MRYMGHITDLLRRKAPGQLVIQFTDHCNAGCPQCGMRVSNGFHRSKLSKDDVKRTIDAAVVRGIRMVSFTGGEPLLFLDDLTEYLEYAGRAGIEYTRTGTNGFSLMQSGKNGSLSKVGRIAEKLAATPLRNFWISIDSADPSVHESMRGFPGIVASIEKALPVFHEFGLYPSANLGINRYVGGEATSSVRPGDYPNREAYLEAFYRSFRSAFVRFFRTVINMGFTMVNSCYPMSIEDGDDGQLEGDLQPVYAATSEDSVVHFQASEKALIFKALSETIPEFRSKIRLFSPRTSLLALSRQYGGYKDFCYAPYPCRGGSDFFFVDARNGHAYPCGYRGGESLGKLWELKNGANRMNAECTLCDWECFRDPSELFGPIFQLLSDPLRLQKKLRRDKHYFRLWLDDLRYYRICDFFDGRKPINTQKLARFKPVA